jgi:hypothetical protein
VEALIMAGTGMGNSVALRPVWVYSSGMTEMTAVESQDGRGYLVELDETAGTIAFLDIDTDAPIASFTVGTFASVTGALSLDLGTERYLDDVAVAQLKQWVRV